MIIESGEMSHISKTQNPFVFAAYHLDHFPEGDGKLEPAVRKEADPNGDYDPDAPWRMYFGQKVPGFPAHPHRGFETVTVVIEGTVDHTDGLGSKGRYENGDVQWMTAGSGMQHAEMFPLRHTDRPNPLELFQLWLSLDSAHRMAEPAYKMLWNEDIPQLMTADGTGLTTKIRVIAGEAGGRRPPDPTPDSWAHDRAHHVSIKLLELEPGASHTIPAALNSMNRSLYFYDGDALRIEEELFPGHSYAFVTAGNDTPLKNEGQEPAKLLLLEATPIPEPIVAQGPFVMSSQAEIRQAYRDYHATRFGGWPFPTEEPYHAPDQERFAIYADGTVEYPGKQVSKEQG